MVGLIIGAEITELLQLRKATPVSKEVMGVYLLFSVDDGQ